MAFCDVHWFSKSIVKQVASYVLLPDTGEGPFPVFYLLHGLSDDHTIWLRRTRIEEYVSGLPLIVVMPDGFRGFYTKNEEGPDYDAYMAKELPAMIERNFPAQTTRAGRCIGGLSMGGYGALRLALAHPDRYCSANSHSGAVMWGSKSWTKPEQAETRRIVGAEPRDTEHDLTFLARRAKSAGTLPQMRIDCGNEDFLYADNQEFHRYLDQEAIPHEYAEYPGVHNWPYWDEHVREAIAFHCKALGIAKQTS